MFRELFNYEDWRDFQKNHKLISLELDMNQLGCLYTLKKENTFKMVYFDVISGWSIKIAAIIIIIMVDLSYISREKWLSTAYLHHIFVFLVLHEKHPALFYQIFCALIFKLLPTHYTNRAFYSDIKIFHSTDESENRNEL